MTTPSTLVAVIAGAGSGKTRVLTTRIAHRIAIGTADARHTLALTFTREAAGELRRRLRRSGVRDHVEAGTFHAVALDLLRQRWADLDRRPPTVVGDRERLLGEIAGGVPLAALATEADWAAARGVAADGYVAAARAAGRRGATPPDRIATALAAYETLKRRRGVVDLDDLLTIAAHELVRRPGVGRRRPLPLPPRARRRGPGPQPGAAPPPRPARRRARRPVPRRRPGAGDLRLQRLGSRPAAGRRHAAARASRSIHLPTNHRCTPQIVAAGAAVLQAGGQPAVAVAGARRRRGRAHPRRRTTRTTRRRSSPRSCAPSTRSPCAPGRSPCWPARTPSCRGWPRRSPPPACR